MEIAKSEPTKGFSLVKTGAFVTIYKVGKKTKFLNHDNKKANYADIELPVADQVQLKEVYDADPSYVSLVIAPDGYNAPWAKK